MIQSINFKNLPKKPPELWLEMVFRSFWETFRVKLLSRFGLEERFDKMHPEISFKILYLIKPNQLNAVSLIPEKV